MCGDVGGQGQDLGTLTEGLFEGGHVFFSQNKLPQRSLIMLIISLLLFGQQKGGEASGWLV